VEGAGVARPTATGSPVLLECTLRDGSYVIDFQFTAADTRRIASELDRLGFPLVEVGHGVGIGASDSVRPAAATDAEYAVAAREGVQRGKWGMFAIPGIASPAGLRAMADEGMDFVRIGVDAFALSEGLEYVAEARRLGLLVFVNFMKSYVLSPEELGGRARQAEEAGADFVYLVDSAGGMLPEDVRAYTRAMRSTCSRAGLGYHGHDNLGLAVSNSLIALEEGLTLIDCTMQGMGRSSGNASSERLVAILARLGDDRYDVAEVLRTGEREIRPRLPIAGSAGLDTYSGFTQFHSSYMPTLLATARECRVDPYRLMLAQCERDRVNGSAAQMVEVARELQTRGARLSDSLPPDVYVGDEQR